MRRAALLSILSLLALIVGLAVAPAAATAAPAARTATAGGSGGSNLGTFSPTFVGSAATGCAFKGCSLLTGPIRTPSTANLDPSDPPPAEGAHVMPSPVHKTDPPGDPVIPIVSCPGAGCATNSGTKGGAYGIKGLNAVDSASLPTNPLGDIEPPDQGLCAGNGYVVEDNNIGEIQVFNSSLNYKSKPIPLDTLMGLTGLGYSSGGDTSCLYDQSNGGHWFFTQFVSTNSEADGGAFTGCFDPAVAHACREGIAVTVGNNPFGPYNVYFLNADYNPQEPGYPYLLNDFAKISATRDAFLLFYDEFPQNPSFPGINPGFNGSQEFAFTKWALEFGLPAKIGPIPNPFFNVAIENLGYVGTPDGTCATTGACWYQTIPAQAPDSSQWDNSRGGSGFMLSSLDFFGNGDNRFAVFDWTGLANLNSPACVSCNNVRFGGQLFSNVEHYYGEGQLGTQKAGPIPLGDQCQNITPIGSTTGPCVEGGIATNGDGFTQVSQANGQIWGAVSTEVNQGSSGTPKIHQGAAYWVVGTGSFDHYGPFTLTSQGYVSAKGEDLEFPTMAAEGSYSQDGGNGGAIMSFTVNGPDYYPSSAFGRVSTTSAGLLGSVYNIVDLGQSPQDGFTEYQGNPGPLRPRWGDYGWALFMPNTGGRIYFASEYIQYPNCSGTAFTTPASGIGVCGGTRDFMANWGTSVNYVIP